MGEQRQERPADQRLRDDHGRPARAPAGSLQSWMAIFEREQIVTDGGAERALLWECDSVHPVDAECKPWGGRDD